ncbi:4,5-dioxygenase [Endozoicomonas montiporae]|uniref:4,5-dioxygenase n=2 Tax=Endozoicomonas montiporae TaxID=1027273 RepID=A0A081N5Z6_9GAMM|nr:DOPA 4,5-dioxygenase family protein [Endozoicomonas montiporae]AMO57217.1 hypothetical protein EZMO1_3214 [Endozoicomonas montiporae CL-33]KEQ13869.1 4,5-dioxygenase [Endozoicomonas montiporae]
MDTIKGYHAHIYFDPDEYAVAESLCRAADERFNLKMGRLHSQPVGPHPRGSCQLAFSAGRFGELIPWLLVNRNSLTVMVHGLTGDDIRDHTEYVFWLGNQETLDLDKL